MLASVIDREVAIADLEAEGLSVTEWRDDAHTSYPEHTHPYREVRIVLNGTMTIRTRGDRHDLVPGARLDLPANEPHSAVVGPHGVHYLAGSER